MNLDFSPEDEAFRMEVRQFIEENYPAELRASQKNKAELDREDQLMWQKVLAKRGWAAPHWPVEWGGTDWTAVQRFIFTEELARADTVHLVPFGLSMLAPVLLAYGTEEQKKRFLPGIYNGEIFFCQGYSEPGAGSDLANLRTRADRVTEDDGKEYYIINGQKTWTTWGQHADWGFFLVRTDTECKPQAGISFLLIDMKSPGITVKPIITVEGGHEVNDVFLDNVKVPVENRVHEENKGWTCAKALLAHERTGIAGVAESQFKLKAIHEIATKEVADDGGRLIDDPAFRRKLTNIEVELEALAMAELRVIDASAAGHEPGAESSIFKLRGSEIKQRLTELAMEAVGYDAVPYILQGGHNEELISEDAVGATWDYLNIRKFSIFGGSNEVQRNIISKAVLGL
ncbi:MAG: acyl-CoA dehydrogenase family protein [Sphingorhabdus sp.]